MIYQGRGYYIRLNIIMVMPSGFEAVGRLEKEEDTYEKETIYIFISDVEKLLLL